MAEGRRVRGMLFDSGGVLVHPVGSRWNPRFDFEDVVLKHHAGIPVELFPEAFRAGEPVLDSGDATANRTDYHRAILAVLGVDDPSGSLLQELEAPPATPAVAVFPDVPPVLDTLYAEGVPMAVVSDNWAGLDAVYRSLGIEKYFVGFVISEVLGCRKPDPRMYAAGSDLLGLEPGACLFVDDDPHLVESAIQLGYQGVALVREGPPPERVPMIRSLAELMAMVVAPA